jgi:hypothetical protein
MSPQTAASSPALARVVERLEEVQPSGDGYTALCPAHDDTRPSLSIGTGDDGRVLLNCHRGCELDAIVKALDLQVADLFVEPKQAGEPLDDIVAVYNYKDEEGRFLYQVVRYADKQFRQRTTDGKGGPWVNNIKGVRRVLYHLDKIQGEETICIVEGEKDVDRLWTDDLPATTNSGGAGKWTAEHTQQLVKAGGKRVFIFPDHDEAGRAHAETVADSCLEAGLKVAVVALPGLSKKGDVSDWIAAGHTADALVALCEAAPPYATNVGLDYITLSDVKAEPVNWLWPGRIPLGMVTILAGVPRTKKSFLACDIAARVTRGFAWPASQDRAPMGEVVLLAAEDHVSQTLRPRMDALGGDCTKLKVIKAVHLKDGGKRTFSLAEDLPKLRLLVKQTGARVVIIDPLNSYLGGKMDGWKDPEVRSVLDPLKELAEELNIAMLLLMHVKKGVESEVLYRIGGSVAFAAVARAIFFLSKDQDDKGRVLFTNPKLSVALEAPTLAFKVAPSMALEWEKEPVDISAEEAMSDRTHRATRLDQAVEWLEDHLQAGPKLVKEIEEAAGKEGISETTLKRARWKLHIIPKPQQAVEEGRKGIIGAWVWELPSTGASGPADLHPLHT